MGIQDLQGLLESEAKNLDLFKVGRNHSGGLRLVLDAEGCLDRLYGGYFSDWACGGQWARCVQFLTTLASALSDHHVSLCVCFNGSHPTPPAHPALWQQQQSVNRQRVNNVLRHVAMKGTPPPKVWWVAPTGLHSCLRTALRYLNIPIMVSSDDHYQEVVGLCREKGYAGIVGNAAEYIVFQPPRYFSSSQLKLTYRSSLETKEYPVHELSRMLDVPADRTCLAAALLGNTIISEHSLNDFYKRIGLVNGKKSQPETLIKAIGKFVSELPSSDIDSACTEIFGDLNDLRAAKLKQAVQYYINGTKDGFLKYKTATARRPKGGINNNNNYNNNKKKSESNGQQSDMDTTKLATESSENDQKVLEEYKLATQNASLNSDLSMEESKSSNVILKHSVSTSTSTSNNTDKENKSSVANTQTEKRDPPKCVNKGTCTRNEDTCPGAPAEVLRTAAERHAHGLMAPALLSILSHRQITLPVLMEDELHRELPSMHHFFRPIRQNVYAILFNMHHHKYLARKSKEVDKNSPPPHTVYISEWIYTKQNQGKTPEIVPGIMLDWPVPTVQRLWFGTAADDKCRRLRAFLSCMRSDTPLMLNTSYVPQHLLILATVLRYIMTSQIQVLRRQELDAFLATAFSTDLMNALHLQEMQVSGVSVRGVQLAALVAAGAETALLANDACGAPVPWLVAAPWLYTDGKLLQKYLQRAQHCKHLVQLCDNNVDAVMKVERMRKAVLEGLEVEFALGPLPLVYGRHDTARLEIAGVVVGQWGCGGRRLGHTYPTRRRQAPLPRRRRAVPNRQPTLSLNGKTVRAEDGCNEDSCGENSNTEGNRGSRVNKNNKRNNRGKKKNQPQQQKTEGNSETTTTQTAIIDKQKVVVNGSNEELVTDHIGQGDVVLVSTAN